MRFDGYKIPWGQGIFSRTKRITMELSNLCNMSEQHRACPAHDSKEKTILSDEIVQDIVRLGKKYSFQGVVAFHMYNEPTLDPRLVYFIRLVKENLPDARIYILTNGWYITQGIANEFVRHGVDFLDVSSYDSADLETLSKISLPIPYRILHEPLDDRLAWYGKVTRERRTQACFCPLYDICVDCRGNVVLCSYDWKRTTVFGNLHAASLESILMSGEMQDLYHELSKGMRRLEICTACPRSRGEPFNEG